MNCKDEIQVGLQRPVWPVPGRETFHNSFPGFFLLGNVTPIGSYYINGTDMFQIYVPILFRVKHMREDLTIYFYPLMFRPQACFFVKRLVLMVILKPAGIKTGKKQKLA